MASRPSWWFGFESFSSKELATNHSQGNVAKKLDSVAPVIQMLGSVAPLNESLVDVRRKPPLRAGS
jgi:hypothetical protein